MEVGFEALSSALSFRVRVAKIGAWVWRRRPDWNDCLLLGAARPKVLTLGRHRCAPPQAGIGAKRRWASRHG